jgi:hypothetical protein
MREMNWFVNHAAVRTVTKLWQPSLTDRQLNFLPRGNSIVLKRRLKVVQWLSTTPSIGTCDYCNKIFKVPLSALTKTVDAQANLQEQFERHECKGKGQAA